MPESSPPPVRVIAIAAVAGIALAALCTLGGVAAAVAGWLAQPAFAIALRGSRTDAGPAPSWRRDALALAVLWGMAAIAAGLLAAWPLSALLGDGGLGAALGLSLVAGLMLIVVWRQWPLWHALERDGGTLGERWRALDWFDVDAWRGLVVAALVCAILATLLLLAWPGLLPQQQRWMLAALCALAWPALHWGLQRITPATALVMHEDRIDDAATAEPATPAPDDPALVHSVAADLYAAARSGRVDRALALIEAGADVHAPPAAGERDQRNLAVLAAVLPDLRLLRALIAAGADLNAAHAGMTPLLAATRDSWHGRPEAVMTLLANGADPRASDNDGNTPLHHAARSTDPGVAALLRDAAAELDVLNHEGLTPLGIACACGNWRMARFLLERGARAEVAGATPALLAAAGGEEDDPAGVLLLLKHKARVDGRDAQGRSALHEAALAGHVEILAALLAAGADIQARDAHARTPLLDAARGGNLPALEALLDAGADVGLRDGDGNSALALASLAPSPSAALLRRLLDLGIDPEQVDRNGHRAVEHAAAAGRWSLVAMLDPGYPLPSSVADDSDVAAPPDRAPLSLLREGLEEGRVDRLDHLARLLSAEELAGLLLDTGLAPARIEWLLVHGADPELRSGQGDTALFTWLARGPQGWPGAQVLLERGASPAGAGGLARFLGACSNAEPARSLEHAALALLERGADPFGASPAGDPPLALAVRLGWMGLVERLVALGVDPDARDSHGMSALHLAAALGREAALKLLVAHGASPAMRAADGQTPLGVALSAGRRDLADWLDWRGWPLPRRRLQATDVPAAAIVGDADAVRRLLDLGFPVDTVDNQGCTALLRAAGGGHRATVDLLLARGADPQRAANTGATPLSAAVSMRQVEIVDRLLAAGAGLEQRLPGDVTVLMLAAALGLPDLCARLLMAGANVHAGDAQGLTPLHCAALFGFTARERPRLMALLDTLLLAGAEPDAVAGGNVSPLLLLLGARAEPGTACDEEVVLTGIERLLDEEVLLDAQDPRGFGPLHLAALHGLLRITQRLLRAGCNPDLRDALNRSPREIAVMRGFVDVAAQFVPATAGGVSMARFLREPR
jgi:ankyrin repeat protein